MIWLARIIGIERPTGICDVGLGGSSGGGRIRRAESGVMGLHAMANSLRCGFGYGIIMDHVVLYGILEFCRLEDKKLWISCRRILRPMNAPP